MSIQTISIPLQSPQYKPFLKEGDTIPAYTVKFGATDNIDLTGAEIRMQLYQNGVKVFDVSTGNGITIDNDKWFTIDEVAPADNTFPCGQSIGDIQITLSTGFRKTFFNVTYSVLKEYTVETT